MLAMPSSRLLFGVVPWYSVLIVGGICAALFIASREEKRLSLPRDTVVDLALWVIPFGVIGARLYYVLFAWETFAHDPISILYIWQGGLAIYGGIIGGFLAVFLFSRIRKIALPTLTDIIVPGLALAQAIGRWGNYFNMEAYGLQITDPAWQFFPIAVLIPGHNGDSWHMATFFYESVWNLAVFTTLMLSRKRLRRPGDTTLWYILLYGAGRLIIEGLRTDSLMAAQDSIRISQLLSVGMCLVVLAIFILRALRHPTRRQIIASGAALAASLALALLLPRPADAFFGYNAAWVLQAVLILTAAAVLPRRVRALPGLLSLAAAIALRWHLASAGLGGVEASTLLCMLFSLTIMTGAVHAYTAQHP